MVIFIIWLVFVILSLFFWAIGKKNGISNENEMPFLVKICYTIAQFPFGLIVLTFIILGHLLGFILKSVIELLIFFSPSEEKTALSKLENLKKENEELMQENKELLNKRDLLLKKLNKKGLK